ncbi:hypothetical protein BGX31_004746, partial [Mortierella sp. GBA43]
MAAAAGQQHGTEQQHGTGSAGKQRMIRASKGRSKDDDDDDDEEEQVAAATGT